MAKLSVEGGFDVHEYRDGLKLLSQDRDSMHFRNRAGHACPACGREFDRLLVSEETRITFGSAPDAPFCIARAPERILVLTHP